MVNARDDQIHPMSSAETIKEIFGQSATLVVVDKAGFQSEKHGSAWGDTQLHMSELWPVQVEDAPKRFMDELAKWLAALPAA